MLKRINISNFRNLKDVSLETPLVTLLIGPNNAGKSGIMHSFMVLKQTLQRSGATELSFVGYLVNLGGRNEVVYQHNNNHDIKLGFEIEDSRGGQVYDVKYSTISHEKFSDIEFSLKGNGTVIDHSGNSTSVVLKGEKLDKNRFSINTESLYFRINILESEKNKIKIDCYDMVNRFIQNIFFVPIFRGIGEFKTEIPQHQPNEITTSAGSKQMSQNILATVNYAHIVDKLSSYTNDLFGLKIRPSLIESDIGVWSPIDRQEFESIESIQPKTSAGTLEFYKSTDKSDINRSYLTNSGFGSNQLILLLLQLIIAPEGSVIFIEEPEISLHPLLQQKLLKKMIGIAKNENKQLIITTHSEHVLFTLFDSIDNKELNNNELAVYSFSQENNNEYSTIKKLVTDDKQNILKSFFEDDDALYLRYIEILGKKDKFLGPADDLNE